MTTRVAPMLAVSDPGAAIEFYRAAFGAEVRWQIDGDGPEVAGLVIDGAEFFLARANPPRTLGPDGIGGTTVRIELFVDDPAAVHAHAVAAGATGGDPPQERTHALSDGASLRMIQGGVTDPFGHIWLIGKFL